MDDSPAPHPQPNAADGPDPMPTWTTALADYPFARPLLPHWQASQATVPGEHLDALVALLSALDPSRALAERYRQLRASHQHLSALAARGDRHTASTLLHLRVLRELGADTAARPLAEQLAGDLQRGATVTLDRPMLPVSRDFDACPPEGGIGPWISAQILQAQEALAATPVQNDPETDLKQRLGRLARLRKLPCFPLHLERRLALTGIQAGKEITIGEGSRVLGQGGNGAIWKQLGRQPQAPHQPAQSAPVATHPQQWAALEAGPNQPRLLLLTTDFPPYDGGRVGHSIRMYTLANFLAEQGYRVYVYLVKNNLQPSRQAPDLHADVILLNPRLPRPASDLDLCADCIDRLGITTLLSSSPPLVPHQLARALTARTGERLFWLCDIRDICSIHPLTKRADAQENRQLQRHELGLMAGADAVTAVSTGMIDAINAMAAEHGITSFAERLHRVENGYLDAKPVAPQPEARAFVEESRRQGRVVLIYAGTGTISGNMAMAKGNKDLTPLLDVLMSDPALGEQFALLIQGRVQVNQAYFSRVEQSLRVLRLPPVDNDQAVANLRLGDIGINVNLDRMQAPMIMGGKIYDYIANGLGLLLLYPSNADSLLAFSARHGNKAFFGDIYDPAAIRGVLDDILSQKGRLEETQFTAEEAQQYHRHAQYHQFLELLPAGVKATPASDVAASQDKQADNRLRVAFLCRRSTAFIGDIEREIGKIHDVRILHFNYAKPDMNAVQRMMDWADVAWFEWCEELVVMASHQLRKTCGVICRLHGFEAFSSYPSKIKGDFVDHMVFVSEYHMRLTKKKAQLSFPTSVIHNGLDLSFFRYREHFPGYRLAFVGSLTFVKNPQMLVQVMAKLSTLDERYELHLAGKVKEPHLQVYFDDILPKLNLQGKFHFYGHVDDIDGWLEDKDYIISTSLSESFGYNIAEAMAKGIKPIIHDWSGAADIYPASCVFRTIDEAVALVTNSEYQSNKYREWVANRYSLHSQMQRIDQCINNYQDYHGILYSGQPIIFFMPNKRDHIQNTIKKSGKFYEFGMLEDIRSRKLSYGVIYDIGANIGNHAIFFGLFCDVSKVVAFEPCSKIFPTLEKNINLNDLGGKIKCLNVGAGEFPGKAKVSYYDEANIGMTKISVSTGGEINVVRLDDISQKWNDKVCLLKIDVEGMELSVLKGAKRILERDSPLVYAEASTIDKLMSLSEYLGEFGYIEVKKFNATPTYLFVKKT